MSVFIRPDSKDGAYSYDFRLSGRRFSGSTGCTSRREARRVEEARRAEARLELAAEKAQLGPNLTIEQACARYWKEKAAHRADAETRLTCLGWLCAHFGPHMQIRDIGDSEVALMVAKRRGERAWGRKDAPLVSPATVNRTATEVLRAVLTRARNTWKCNVGDIAWKDHLLEEPEGPPREASAAEEAKLHEAMPEGYQDVLDAAFLTGARRCELVGKASDLTWALRWKKVDFFQRRIEVTGKGGRTRFIPMTDALYALLKRLHGNHPEFVFTYVATRTREVRRKDDRGQEVVEKIMRGRRYPITEAGMKSVARRKFPASGVEDFTFHDARHTAGSRVTRAAGIRVTQALLGHADVTTTQIYAHVQDADIRRAMEGAVPRDAASLTEIATEEELMEAIALIRQRKSV